MSRSAWFRLAFLVCSTAFVLGLVELAFWAGWAVALGVSVGGLALALLVAEDWSQHAAPASEDGSEQGSPAAQRRRLLREAGVRANGSDD